MRVERLCELLATTDWTVKEIAYEMQFDTSEELSRFIRRNLNTSATLYRESLRGNSKPATV